MRKLERPSLDRLRSIAGDGSSSLPPSPDERYRLVAELGRGGMGIVYLAADAKLDRDVALKMLRPDLDPRTLRARIVREAKVLARLEHPGIVPIYDVGPLEEDQFHYTMKRIDGEPLGKHLQEHPGRNERLRLFLRLCEPVAFAHARGVIHRDLKPGNVMIGSFGEVVVLDWGLAKLDSATYVEAEHAKEADSPPAVMTPCDPDAATVAAPPRPHRWTTSRRTR